MMPTRRNQTPDLFRRQHFILNFNARRIIIDDSHQDLVVFHANIRIFGDFFIGLHCDERLEYVKISSNAEIIIQVFCELFVGKLASRGMQIFCG